MTTVHTSNISQQNWTDDDGDGDRAIGARMVQREKEVETRRDRKLRHFPDLKGSIFILFISDPLVFSFVCSNVQPLEEEIKIMYRRDSKE